MLKKKEKLLNTQNTRTLLYSSIAANCGNVPGGAGSGNSNWYRSLQNKISFQYFVITLP
jgi:hypothetical protein